MEGFTLETTHLLGEVVICVANLKNVGFQILVIISWHMGG
jgi:hypothetical protein